jgi:hypothetical protein
VPELNNYFDTHTVTECSLRLLITAREGGPLLRRAAEAAARGRLPGDGWRLIDVRHELPDAWARYTGCAGRDDDGGHIDLRFERRMFPFVPDGREIVIGGMAILLGLGAPAQACRERACACSLPEGCPCPEHPAAARAMVEFHQGDAHCGEDVRVECLENEAWPSFYFGTVKTRIGPIADQQRPGTAQLRFSRGAQPLQELFLLCRYAPASAPADCCGYKPP